MNLISRIILGLFVVNTAVLVAASLLWRNKNTNFGKFLMTGSYIYRDLPKYIKQNRTKPYLAVSYSFILLFMLLIVSLFI